MFKIRRIKALQDNTPSRNLANEFINEQGSFATLKGTGAGKKDGGGEGKGKGKGEALGNFSTQIISRSKSKHISEV